MRNTFIFIVGLAFFSFSCNKEDLSYEEQLAKDTKIIDDYLLKNNILAEKTTEGLRYNIFEPGSGLIPRIGSTVTVIYTGSLLDGSIFDSGVFSFSLGAGEVIQGWDIGIALLSRGAKATLYIPSGLAYGKQGSGSIIGPNEVLIFKVELALNYEEQLKVDTKIIEDYLTDNGLTADTTVEGLRYKITTTGNGEFPKNGSTVVVNYTGKFLDESVFDSNTTGGFSFPLGQGRVIQGWDIGIALLSKGGKATLYLPSGLAYGTRGAGSSIGPNAVLMFDVELVDIR